MTVLCKKIFDDSDPLVMPKDMSQRIDDINFVASSEWNTISNTISGYCLTEGLEYFVFGILLFSKQIRYLVFDDNNIPGFFPAGLFKICDSSTNFDWRVAEYSTKNGCVLFVGCPLYTEAYVEIADLVNCEKEAIEKLLKYKDTLF